jgi:hypothetical protein
MLDFRTGGAGPAKNVHNERSVETPPESPPDATAGPSTPPLEIMLDFRMGARPTENAHEPCPDTSAPPLALVQEFRTGARRAENNEHDVETPAEFAPIDATNRPSPPPDATNGPLELIIDFRAGGAGPVEGTHNERDLEMRAELAPDNGRIGPSARPLELTLDLRTDAENNTDDELDDIETLAEKPANSNARGSLNYDRANGKLPLEWPDLDTFHAWRRNEELAHSIELIASRICHGGQVWTLRRNYVCARAWSGGESRYETTTNQKRKIPSKKTGCPCNITIKCYRDTKVVLGRYENRHDHPIGIANEPFMRLTDRSWEQMRAMVIQKVDPREIVRKNIPF